jgi:two-component system nitrogen regulation response regulator NtrX
VEAHHGTIFLDEIGELPLGLQVKLLRALQEEQIRRVGDNKDIQLDVRVVAATVRDLAKAVEQGEFREDLYYRLNVVPLAVVPLRQRREDIPELIRHFMDRAADVAGLPSRRINDDALATLQAYDWPGNVRQLRNVIDWILIMAPGGPDEPVGADMLPPDIGAISPSFVRGEAGSEMMSLPLRDARGIFERRYLEAQVLRFGGNISKTASFVGMERSALHRKLRSLGIHTPERQ